VRPASDKPSILGTVKRTSDPNAFTDLPKGYFADLFRSVGREVLASKLEIQQTITEDGSEQIYRIVRLQKNECRPDFSQFLITAWLAISPTSVANDLRELADIGNDRKRGRSRLKKTYDDFVISLSDLRPQSLVKAEFREQLMRIANSVPLSNSTDHSDLQNFICSALISDTWDDLFIIAEFKDEFIGYHWCTTA
jgi:hypothetical protein